MKLKDTTVSDQLAKQSILFLVLDHSYSSTHIPISACETTLRRRGFCLPFHFKGRKMLQREHIIQGDTRKVGRK